MTWRDFWNGETTIYVSSRHREIHYRTLAEDIVSMLPDGEARVLDFGCGEALSADVVAGACRSLVLCDAAETVRAKVRERTRHLANTRTVTPEAVEAMPDGAFDVIVANSVIQYLAPSELQRWLETWRRVLAPTGQLVLGDIVPRRVGPLKDAAALIRFAMEHGFLLAAAGGLVRTALSDYRRKRAELGLLQLDEHEIVALARAQGFQAARSDRNLGHNPARLTIVARPVPEPARQPQRERMPQAYNVLHSAV
ncbi:MAG: methyltransferase domain-containing protein [Hyphomicrobiaceae bacterium]|nr:methyltransferase domain-containing protein [Hyphomicrobiaceae bacterium]